MNTKTINVIAVMLAVMGSKVPAVAEPAANDDVASLVKAVMGDRYSSGYDAKHVGLACRWKRNQGDEID